MTLAVFLVFSWIAQTFLKGAPEGFAIGIAFVLGTMASVVSDIVVKEFE